MLKPCRNHGGMIVTLQTRRLRSIEQKATRLWTHRDRESATALSANCLAGSDSLGQARQARIGAHWPRRPGSAVNQPPDLRRAPVHGSGHPAFGGPVATCDCCAGSTRCSGTAFERSLRPHGRQRRRSKRTVWTKTRRQRWASRCARRRTRRGSRGTCAWTRSTRALSYPSTGTA